MYSKLIDLTHEIHPGIPTWGGACGFRSKITCDYKDQFRVMEYEMVAGCGTHLDAPAHIVEGADDVATLDLNRFYAPAVVIDVSIKVVQDSTYKVTEEDIKIFEQKFGKIPVDVFVLAYTGWAKRWSDPDKYRNDVEGVMSFPTFSVSAVDYLLERNISGIGIDTLSPDGPSSGFSVHEKILGAGKVILENLTNLELVPNVGAWIIAFPMKIKGGTESPVRVVAAIPR